MLMAAPAMAAAETPAAAPMKVAIVGMANAHVNGLLSALHQRKDVELVGIAEPDAALTAAAMTKYNLPKSLFYARLEDLIEARHPEAVLVYTSVADHRAVIETAAHYGVSAMVEKPLTITLADALAIRKVAREHHIQVLVNYETTWQPSARAAFDEAENGKLGAIRRVDFHTGHQGPATAGVSPEFLRMVTDPAKSGAGALYDFGCYGADLMTWLMHGQTPLTVTAVLNHDRPQLYPNVDDDATVVLAYPQTQAVINASWNWPFARKDMEIYGSSGTAATAGAGWLRVRHELDANERTVSAPPLNDPQDDPLSYLDAVLVGEVNPKGSLSSLEVNVVVMQILDAARESARTGQTVKLDKLEE